MQKSINHLKGKLKLKKETIVQLDSNAMRSVKGGSPPGSGNRDCIAYNPNRPRTR